METQNTEFDTRQDGLAVVTGASAGLGRELALELARRGIRVAAIARSRSRLEQLAAAAPLDRILPLEADVGDPEAVAEAFAMLRQAGHPTILINNAAVYPHRDLLNESPRSFMQTVEINLGGMVACSHEALKDMVELGYGRIVNVTTYAGSNPIPTSAAYSVSKGATRIFTAALHADLGDRFPDIVINEWIPGALATPMGFPEGIQPAQAAKWGVDLALWSDRELSGLTFSQNRSVPTPAGWKRRLLNLVLRQVPQVYTLGDRS